MFPSHKYSDLGLADKDLHDDSSTDAGDSLMGDDEQPWHRSGSGRETRGQRMRATLQSYRWLVDTSLLLIIVGLMLERRWHQHRYGEFELAGDMTGFAPKMGQQVKIFAPDPLYAPENASEFRRPEVRQKWIDLVPTGLGFVRLEHPEKYNNLPTPLEGYEGTVFTTSMTHQLHCLYAIVETYSDLVANPGHMPNMTWHLGHCFDYLRQSIMCCGDTSLEGQQTTFPDGWLGSDGWDAKHVCKDYSQIKRYLYHNRADNSSWI